jgi:hypothetical protein
MNDTQLHQLRDILRRRELTAAEQEQLRSRLGSSGEAWRPWDEEAELTRCLTGLPDAPLPSNFTSLVLQAVEREPVRRRWAFPLPAWWARARPAIRFATPVVCLLLVSLAYAGYRSASRARMATSVARVVRSVQAASALAQLPPVDILRDFDAIHGMGQSREVADEALLMALKMD